VRNVPQLQPPPLLGMSSLITIRGSPRGGEPPDSGGGRPTIEYYLNRKQAIFITAKSETPIPTDTTIEIIERFDAYERGDAGLETSAPDGISADRTAGLDPG
jgi:hypothetical protein